jgi:hypothetical protein
VFTNCGGGGVIVVVMCGVCVGVVFIKGFGMRLRTVAIELSLQPQSCLSVWI